ncbi:MAG: hypothetical protein ACJA1F_001830 [Paracoccaceae bacterium]|jgi:hypothetical protein
MYDFVKVLGLALGLGFGAANVANAGAVELDFGTSEFAAFGTGTNLSMFYDNVATDIEGRQINATLTAIAAFVPKAADKNGSVAGDIRVNLEIGQTVELALRLFDDATGLAYDPGVNFSWTLGFFDIDGGANSYDVVTLKTPAQYTVTSTTDLNPVSSAPGQVTFSGLNTGGNVAGESGLTPPLTQDQADAMVLFTVSNTSEVIFDYSHFGTNTSGGRNLLVDGGSLKTALDDFDPVTEVNVVPLPFSGVLIAGGLLVLGGLRRMRRS